MKLYEEITQYGLLNAIQAPLAKGELEFCLDGRVRANYKLDLQRPWINAVIDKERNCETWFGLYFKYYQIIPLGCRNCWKITWLPKNLEQAIKVLELQEAGTIPSKTGLELRRHLGRLGGYGSYWYSPLTGGLGWARTILEQVQGLLMKEFGTKIIVRLKRGCTEMEHAFLGQIGNSTQWDKSAEGFNIIEERLDRLFDTSELDKSRQIAGSKDYRDYVLARWIEYAYEHGDETYKMFTDKKSFRAPIVDYSILANKLLNFPVTWKSKEEIDDSASEIDTLV